MTYLFIFIAHMLCHCDKVFIYFFMKIRIKNKKISAIYCYCYASKYFHDENSLNSFYLLYDVVLIKNNGWINLLTQTKTKNIKSEEKKI